jgi:hypothetical protein
LHLRRDFALRLITVAGIADRGEADRAWFSRKREDVEGGRAGVDGAAAIEGGGCPPASRGMRWR